MTTTTKPDVVLPVIHMNGTSADSLTDDLCRAYSALSDAYDKVKNTAPNGRDYYPAGPEQFEAARAQHYARLDAIHAVMDSLVAQAEGIQDIVSGRALR